MKVLLLASWYPNSRSELGKFIKVQAEYLRLHCDVFVFDCSHRLPLVPHLIQNLYLKLKLRFLLWRKKWRPDIIHVHVAFPAGVIGLELKRKWQCPVVVTEHTGPVSLLEPYFGSATALSKMYSDCDGIIAVSEFQRKAISKYIDQEKIEVIGNIVDDQYFGVELKKGHTGLLDSDLSAV